MVCSTARQVVFAFWMAASSWPLKSSPSVKKNNSSGCSPNASVSAGKCLVPPDCARLRVPRSPGQCSPRLPAQVQRSGQPKAVGCCCKRPLEIELSAATGADWRSTPAAPTPDAAQGRPCWKSGPAHKPPSDHALPRRKTWLSCLDLEMARRARASPARQQATCQSLFRCRKRNRPMAAGSYWLWPREFRCVEMPAAPKPMSCHRLAAICRRLIPGAGRYATTCKKAPQLPWRPHGQAPTQGMTPRATCINSDASTALATRPRPCSRRIGWFPVACLSHSSHIACFADMNFVKGWSAPNTDWVGCPYTLMRLRLAALTSP